MKQFWNWTLILFIFLNVNDFVHAQENTPIKNLDTLTNKHTQDKHSLLKDRFSVQAGLYSSNKGIKVLVNGSSENEIIDFSEKANFNENELTFF